MKTYTKKEMAHLLNVSSRTILNDIQFLNLNSTFDDRGTKLYSEKAFNLISQLRKHCQDKNNNRESFVPNSQVEILDIEPVVTKLPRLENKDSQLNNYRETVVAGFKTDPLFDLELLQRISDRGWLLPTARLAPLLNLSPSYLTTFDHYSYCGFIATKDHYVGNKIIWKITQKT